MAGEPEITVVGNLTGDPELRFTPNGAAVANFTIASTPRNYDRASGEWKEGQTLFLRASIWRDAAENVAETLKKGMRVIASGKLVSRTYTTKEGEERSSFELQVDEIGPSLRWATASVTPKRSNANFSRANQPQAGAPQQAAPASSAPAPAAGDPWSQQSSGNYDWGSGADEEPPF